MTYVGEIADFADELAVPLPQLHTSDPQPLQLDTDDSDLELYDSDSTELKMQNKKAQVSCGFQCKPHAHETL